MSEHRQAHAPASGDRERGAMHVAAIPAVAGLLALAVVLIVMLGSATADRRESTTAADAAALAAAQEWDRRLGNVFGLHVGAGEHVGFWGLAGLPVLGDGVRAAMAAEASRYADRNGAELVAFAVDAGRREVTVRVRNDDTVPETGTRMTAEATARVELTGGLCVAEGRLGYRIDGACAARPEPEPAPSPTPTPSPDPSGEPTPSPTPTGFEPPAIGLYRSDVVLVS